MLTELHFKYYKYFVLSSKVTVYIDTIIHLVCILVFIFSFCYQTYSDGDTNTYFCKGPTRKLERDFLQRNVVREQGAMALN